MQTVGALPTGKGWGDFYSCASTEFCTLLPKHAPGVPRILVGNRLHLAFKRQVPTEQARAYAEKNCMTFFEVSPLCNFNVIESFTELSRIVLMRHGMEKIWRPNRGGVGAWLGHGCGTEPCKARVEPWGMAGGIKVEVAS